MLKVNPRTMSEQVVEMNRCFPCVMVTGARQVGKSTMLRSLMPPDMQYVNLDDYRALAEAKSDPIGFLETHGTPLCIDEVQYAPELLRAIKLKVDERPGEVGLYWLTGSQRFHMMKGVTESLAGRVGVLDLSTYSQSEAAERGSGALPFSPEPAAMKARLLTAPVCALPELYRRIWMGGYPALLSRPHMTPANYFPSYVQTYVERDVAALSQVGDRAAFMTFMQSAAARTGQQLVYSDIARDAGVSVNTARQWMSILETSGIVNLLQPYHVNTTKRLAKSPKLYFMDTGLCSWLVGWSSPELLQNGAMAGAILETWVYGQLVRSFRNAGMQPRLSYYRTGSGAEVDFLLEQDGCIYPMEVKRSSSPGMGDLRAAATIPPGRAELRPGIVLCTSPELISLGRGCYGFPISAL